MAAHGCRMPNGASVRQRALVERSFIDRVRDPFTIECHDFPATATSPTRLAPMISLCVLSVELTLTWRNEDLIGQPTPS